jgi:hypothetical protein
MNETLPIALRITGGALIGLALLHVPIARHLNWREDCSRLTPVNSAIFHVHALFICLMLVLMGLPALVDPAVFIERSRAGGWLSWSFAGFWMFTKRTCGKTNALKRQCTGSSRLFGAGSQPFFYCAEFGKPVGGNSATLDGVTSQARAPKPKRQSTAVCSVTPFRMQKSADRWRAKSREHSWIPALPFELPRPWDDSAR